ncbi:glycosyltransferase family 4 protein [Thermodesulfobacteriota bacterium]
MTTILHICDWYRPIGGAEKLFFDSLALLEEDGHLNIVAYNDHEGQQPGGMRPEYAVSGLESFVYFSIAARWRSNSAKERLDEIIGAHSPDVCHIHNFQNPFVTRHLIKTIPCVRSIHDPRLYCFTNWRLLPDNTVCPYPLGPKCIEMGCLSSGRIPRNPFDQNAPWVLRHLEVHKKVPILIGESRAQIECMLENGFFPEQIAWLPNFTPIEPQPEVERFLEEYYRPEEKIALFVGRASFEKGAHVVIEACKYLKSDCKVVLITAGPLLEEIQSQAARFGNRIEVIPGLSYEDTRKYYARSSVVIVPSVWIESFCLVGLEAYANMKPVIGSEIGGMKDWLKHDETGWFFEPGNAKELADRIDFAIENPALTARMGRAGYARACQYYSGDIYLARLVAIYERAIKIFREKGWS